MTAPVIALRDWRDYAACRDLPVDDFFPVGREDSPGYIRQAERAIAVCTGCTVRPECLRFATEARREYGVWGGTSDAERRAFLPSLTRGTA